MEDRKKSAEQKIAQMKESALNDIKIDSIKIGIKAVEHIISNSVDKEKLEKIYIKSLDQAKNAFKQTRD